MKTGLLSIIACAVLLCLFFCGCTNSEKTSNQHSTNEAEKVASSASTITDNGDLPAETKASVSESEVATTAEQIVSSVAQNLKPAEKEAESEPAETIITTTTPADNAHAEPEIDFSDLL
jgi:hypothetical protein